MKSEREKAPPWCCQPHHTRTGQPLVEKNQGGCRQCVDPIDWWGTDLGVTEQGYRFCSHVSPNLLCLQWKHVDHVSCWSCIILTMDHDDDLKYEERGSLHWREEDEEESRWRWANSKAGFSAYKNKAWESGLSVLGGEVCILPAILTTEYWAIITGQTNQGGPDVEGRVWDRRHLKYVKVFKSHGIEIMFS